MKNPFLGLWNTVKKNDRTILTGITVVSGITAVIFTWRARPRCEEILDRLDAEGATNAEKAKEILPVIAPAAVSIFTCVASALLNHKRTGDTITTLASALQIGQTVHEEYVKSTEKVVGTEKAEEIATGAARTIAESKPVAVDRVVDTGNGKFIFREPFTGVTLRTSRARIEEAVAEGNNVLADAKRRVDDDFQLTLHDFLELCGVPDSEIPECAYMWSWKWPDDEMIRVTLVNTFDYKGEEPGYLLQFTNFGKPTLSYYKEGMPRY